MAQRIASTFLLCVFFVVAAGPGVAQRSSEDKPQNGANAAQTAKTDLRGTKESPFIVQTIPSDRTQSKTPEDQEPEKEKAFADKIVAYSTLALAIFPFLLAAFTLGLMIFTYKLWNTTRALVVDATAASEAAVKAVMPVLWPLITRMELVPEGGKVPNAHFVIQNYGKSPGMVREVRAKLIIGEKSTVPKHFDFTKELPRTTDYEGIVASDVKGDEAFATWATLPPSQPTSTDLLPTKNAPLSQPTLRATTSAFTSSA